MSHPEPDPELVAEITDRYTPVDWAAAFKGQPDEIDWLWDEFLEVGTINALFAKPGTGKSLVALEIAATLARSGVPVVYVDDENRITDLVERLQAMGLGPDDLALLHMYSFAGLPPLDSERGGLHLLALATSHQARLVVLDTTTRMVAGRENDSDTFLQLYRCSLVPLKSRGMTVLRLDHPGKDTERGQRGSSAKDGDVDTIWQLITDTDGLEYRMERTKTRSGHGPDRFALRRQYEPLRHVWNCPQGDDISKIAGQLDDLNVPVSAGRPTVRAALKAAGISVNNAQLTAAIKHRKTVPDSSRTARTAGSKAANCPAVPHVVRDSGQLEQPPVRACPRHQTKFGPRKGCPGCEALSAAAG